jgi:hypothetical protein
LPAPGGPSRIRFNSLTTEAAYPLASAPCRRPVDGRTWAGSYFKKPS